MLPLRHGKHHSPFQRRGSLFLPRMPSERGRRLQNGRRIDYCSSGWQSWRVWRTLNERRTHSVAGAENQSRMLRLRSAYSAYVTAIVRQFCGSDAPQRHFRSTDNQKCRREVEQILRHRNNDNNNSSKTITIAAATHTGSYSCECFDLQTIICVLCVAICFVRLLRCVNFGVRVSLLGRFHQYSIRSGLKR